jgi:hypothetical protein
VRQNLEKANERVYGKSNVLHFYDSQPVSRKEEEKSVCKYNDREGVSGGQCRARTCDLLLVSQLTTLIRACRSDRKAGGNQQLVISGDKLLTPFSSSFSRRFAAICHD